MEIVDAELTQDKEYASMGKTPADRVKALLGKLDTMRRGKERGFNVTNDIRRTSRKFVGRVAKIFKSLSKSLEWRSFYSHDLPILIDFCEEVREASMQNRLNRSQTLEGIIHEGQIRLKSNFHLPDKTKVYVVVPDIQGEKYAHIFSPRLANPEQAIDFKMQVTQE